MDASMRVTRNETTRFVGEAQPVPREDICRRVENLAQRIHARAEAVTQIKDRVRDICDRLHGMVPTEKAQGHPAKELPNISFAHVEDADTRLHNAIAELDVQISRL